MIKNIVYASGIIITLVSYYFFYEYQNSKFSNIETQLNALNQKLDSITLNSEPPLNNTAINYKENNIVKNEIINFSELEMYKNLPVVFADKDNFTVGAEGGAIIVKRVRSGKEKMSAAEYAKNSNLKVGLKFG